jgi:hypothetical protein
LETPEEFTVWRAAGQRKDAERDAKRALRSANKKPQRGGPEPVDGESGG